MKRLSGFDRIQQFEDRIKRTKRYLENTQQAALSAQLRCLITSKQVQLLKLSALLAQYDGDFSRQYLCLFLADLQTAQLERFQETLILNKNWNDYREERLSELIADYRSLRHELNCDWCKGEKATQDFGTYQLCSACAAEQEMD